MRKPDLFERYRQEIDTPRSKSKGPGRPDLFAPAVFRTLKRSAKRTVGITLTPGDCPKRKAFLESIDARRNTETAA
jgi:hypothetical protein